MTTLLEQTVNQQAVENVRAIANASYDSLVNNHVHGRLPEDVFRYYFLPYFSGMGPVHPQRNVIAEWIGVAGTAMTEVDVFAPDMTILFTVPALFDTSVIDVTKQRAGNSFSSVIDNYQLRQGGVPAVAINYVNQALAVKMGEITMEKPDRMAIAKQRWDLIMMYYGIIPRVDGTAAKLGLAAPAPGSDDEDLIYD